jgi:CheY-like chemotaxis protein
LARSPEADPYGLVSEAEQRVAKETVAAMAHRFNSLLGAVVLGAKTLQGDLDPEHPLAEVAANMADTALQAGALAEALLGAVGRRLPPGHGRVRSLFRLNSVVSEALEVWGGFPGNAEVVVELDPLVGSVRGQKEQLTLALHDIFSSVVDALSDGGQVSIRTLAVGRGRRLWAEVAVEYTSRSAAADVAEPPLVPWTASVRSGKGLGLAVAVGMAANHGGKVELQHVAPNTVRITVELPTADVPKVARSTGRRSKGGTEAILIVDDEPQIRKIGRRLLERLGYRVAVAANGQAAVDLLNDPDTAAFDLAVLDLTMPGMSTPELFRRLKERLPNLKVVLFTGCDLDSIATSLLNEGADAFLQKPDGAASLPKVVRRLLDGRSVPRA